MKAKVRQKIRAYLGRMQVRRPRHLAWRKALSWALRSAENAIFTVRPPQRRLASASPSITGLKTRTRSATATRALSRREAIRPTRRHTVLPRQAISHREDTRPTRHHIVPSRQFSPRECIHPPPSTLSYVAWIFLTPHSHSLPLPLLPTSLLLRLNLFFLLVARRPVQAVHLKSSSMSLLCDT